MEELKMWERIDKAFAHCDEVFQELDKLPLQLNQRSGYYIITRTTTSTVEPRTAPSYSDGFDDGWNAHEAAQ